MIHRVANLAVNRCLCKSVTKENHEIIVNSFIVLGVVGHLEAGRMVGGSMEGRLRWLVVQVIVPLTASASLSAELHAMMMEVSWR